MGGFSHFEQLHEVFKRYGVLEFECSLADVLKVFGRDEVTDTIEDVFEGFLINLSLGGMEVEDFHEGLSLCCFN